ncbi:VWA domain-containing protein [Brevibacillus sp. B_LB10_24]|uniref:VWA domain-containing protein n=1 Tax=Brevibacillus sp. B_LB10_24 TaxID=3380645 RepID=UPI0038BDDDB2
MRKYNRFAAIILVFSLLSLTACSSVSQEAKTDEVQQQAADPTAADTVDEAVLASTKPESEQAQGLSREAKIKKLQSLIPEGRTKIPQSAQDFVDFPPGYYAGKTIYEAEEEINTKLRQFPNIENPDQEIIDMYFLALLGLFAEDYPDPMDIITEIKLASFGSPEIDDPRYKPKENYNVEIILDASGSMAEKAGGKTRMEAAKEAIASFAESLPKEANVALRVYGHKGSGKESDKALSCGSSELVYGMEPYNANKMLEALSQFRPVGYTPIAYSLQEAMKDFRDFPGEKNTNIIYLVSDGIETCGGDPVEVAKQLASSDITPIVNVIGFGTDGEGQQHLKAVAQAAGGRFVLIQNQEELQKEFEQAQEIADKWWQWKSDSSYESFSAHLDQSLDILRFSMDWVAKSNNEDYNIYSALQELSYRDTLPKEIIAPLSKKRQERYKLVQRHEKELENLLNSVSNKSYKEAVKAIDEIYKRNVK